MHDLIQIVFRPRFPLDEVAVLRDDAARGASETAVARWSELLPGPKRRVADHEDWHENAAALMAAVDSGLPVFVMEIGDRSDQDSWTRVARAINTDAAAAPDPRVPTLIIGSLQHRDPLSDLLDVQWPLPSAFLAAERYFSNPSFPELAARAVALAVHTDEGDPGHGGEDNMVPTIARMAREFGPDLMLKIVNRTKYARVQPLRVDDPEDRNKIHATLLEMFEYDLVHVDGEIPRFLVQELIGLEAEYRIAVVDLEPVTGAACIESMCPPWNAGEPFHGTVEGRRGSGVLREDPELVGRYVAAARRAAQALHAGDPGFRDAVLDFGLKPDGTVALIEANPLGNFGLYAMDYGRFLDAAVRAVSERLPAPQGEPPRGP